MVELEDLRFDQGQWPIQLTVPAHFADHWIAHLDAERGERGWSSSGLGQQHADENSGTLVVNTGPAGRSPALEIVWDRPRRGSIAVRARPAGTPPMALDAANLFLAAVDARCQADTKDRLHRRGHLLYEGLPWRGELWLSEDLRLGPPSRHASWLVAPQVIIVDALVDGIGWRGVNSSFNLLLRQRSIFLNVVAGVPARLETSGWAWTYETDTAGTVINCDLRTLAYIETVPCDGMPQAGQVPPVPLLAVQRPGLERWGVSMAEVEQAVPQDIQDLWRKFTRLPDEERDQFLRAGNAYVIARSMWPDQMTAYMAFMVVACESLKPTGKRYDKCNMYDVVEGLLGDTEAQKLRQLRLAPQRVRSRHFHRGQLAAGELASILLRSHFADPSFSDAASALTRTTRTCLIEWLRRDGRYPCNPPPAERKTEKT